MKTRRNNLKISTSELESLHRPHSSDTSRLCSIMCPWAAFPIRTQNGEDLGERLAPQANGTGDRLLLTIQETARRLSLGRSKTYQLALAGSLPVVHIGRSLRVPVDALERWVQAQIRRPWES